MSEDPKDNQRRETGFLNTPQAQPMPDREVRPQTAVLGPNSKVEVKIGDRKIMLDITDTMLFGRAVEGDDPKSYALDLGSFGGYQSGVSRQHAVITQHEGALYIEDLGSTNGTRINGFQLTARRKYRLRDGDEVEFARLRMVFHFINTG